MRIKGRIVTWHDEKGYGFLTPLAGGDRVFIHIKAFTNRARRPAIGDIVTYSLSTDSRGRRCADAATIAGVPKPAKTRTPSSALLPVLLATGFLTGVGAAVVAAAVPVSVFVAYFTVSLVTFTAYALDKLAAQKRSWRTSEATLHLLALVGGWPGALLAQNRLRHKTRKQPFRTVFWGTVILNGTAFAWLLSPAGAQAWRSVVSTITGWWGQIA